MGIEGWIRGYARVRCGCERGTACVSSWRARASSGDSRATCRFLYALSRIERRLTGAPIAFSTCTACGFSRKLRSRFSMIGTVRRCSLRSRGRGGSKAGYLSGRCSVLVKDDLQGCQKPVVLLSRVLCDAMPVLKAGHSRFDLAERFPAHRRASQQQPRNPAA